MNQLVERKERVLLFGLQGHLAAYGTQDTEPDHLNEQWAQDEIIQNIKADFGSDLAPFAKLSLPIDFYRTLYTGHVEVWHEQQSKRLNDLLELLAAYGMYDPSSTMLAPADSLRFVRKRVLTISRLRRAAFWLFVGTCVTFLSALLFLAYAIFP